MCDEFIEVFNKLKNDNTLSSDDKNYIKESKTYIIKNKKYGSEIYYWKSYGDIIIYRNYDSVTDHIPHYRKGKRKLNKELFVSGLPKHCFK